MYASATTQDTFSATVGGSVPTASLIGPQFSSQVHAFSNVLAVSSGENDQATFADTSTTGVDEFFAQDDAASLLSPARAPTLTYTALGFSDVSATTANADDELNVQNPTFSFHPIGPWASI